MQIEFATERKMGEEPELAVQAGNRSSGAAATLLRAGSEVVWELLDMNKIKQTSEASLELGVAAVDHLCSLGDAHRLVETPSALVALKVVHYQLPLIHRRANLSAHTNRSMARLLVQTLERIYVDFGQLMKCVDQLEDTASTELNYLLFVCYILSTWTGLSIEFAHHVCANEGVRIIFAYLENEDIQRLLARQRELKVLYTRLFWFYRGLLGTAHNLSYLYVECPAHWCGAYARFSRLADLAASSDELGDYRLVIHLTMANVADEHASVGGVDEKHVREMLVSIAKVLGQLVRRFDEEKVQREATALVELAGQTRLVAFFIDESNNDWFLTELLTALYRLAAVNDALKYEIYNKHGLAAMLRKIIERGNATEQEYALRFLWQLCFNERVAADVLAETTLIALLRAINSEPMMELSDEEKRGLSTYSSGVCWLLEKFRRPAASANNPGTFLSPSRRNSNQQQAINKTQQQQNQLKQVMISYSRKNRDLCLSIKAELERVRINGGKETLKVYMDEEELSGLSLETMTAALEQSQCVLICLTERYKQSPFCRTEAEFVHREGKPFVPIILQADYKISGWLGDLVNGKKCIDFTRHTIRDGVKRLNKELAPIFSYRYEEDEQRTISLPSRSSPTPSRAKTARATIIKVNSVSKTLSNGSFVDPTKWSVEQVSRWIRECKFHKKIVESIEPSNGKQLAHMYKMFKSVPDAFYSSLNTNGPINLKELTLFTTELLNLFEQE